MHGSFAVGSAVLPQPQPQPQPQPTPKPALPTRLTGTVGPGFTIALKTVAGAPVKRLKPGAYTVVVHDLSTIHNFVLVGPGVSRSTKVLTKSTVTWRVTLQRGTYRFFCKPHQAVMKGSFRVL
jgi:Copper binding proteins, plastocyanin/azurin family